MARIYFSVVCVYYIVEKKSSEKWSASYQWNISFLKTKQVLKNNYMFYSRSFLTHQRDQSLKKEGIFYLSNALAVRNNALWTSIPFWKDIV